MQNNNHVLYRYNFLVTFPDRNGHAMGTFVEPMGITSGFAGFYRIALVLPGVCDLQPMKA